MASIGVVAWGNGSARWVRGICAMVDVGWVEAVRWWQSLISSLWPPQWICTATHKERCSSHWRPTMAETHKGQIRDPQRWGRNPRRGSRIRLLWVFSFGWYFGSVGGGGDGGGGGGGVTMLMMVIVWWVRSWDEKERERVLRWESWHKQKNLF